MSNQYNMSLFGINASLVAGIIIICVICYMLWKKRKSAEDLLAAEKITSADLLRQTEILNAKIKAQSENLDKKVSEIAELKEKIKDLSARLADTTLTRDKIAGDAAEVKNQLDQQKKQTAVVAQIVNNDPERSYDNAELGRLRSELESKTALISELTESKSSYLAQVNTLNSDIARLQSQLSAAPNAAEVARLRGEIELKVGIINNLNMTNGGQTSKINSLYSDIARLQSQLSAAPTDAAFSQLRAELESKSNLVNNLTESKSSYLAQVNTLNSDIARLQSQLSAAPTDAAFASLRAELESKTNLVNNLTESKSSYLSQINSLNNDIARLQSQLSADRTELSDSKSAYLSQINALNSDIARLQSQLSTAPSEAAFAQLRAELESKTNLVNNLTESNSSYLAQVNTLNSDNTRLQSQLAEAIAANDAAELVRLRDELVSKSALITDLSTSNSERLAIINALNNDISSLQSQLKAAAAKCAELEAAAAMQITIIDTAAQETSVVEMKYEVVLAMNNLLENMISSGRFDDIFKFGDHIHLEQCNNTIITYGACIAYAKMQIFAILMNSSAGSESVIANYEGIVDAEKNLFRFVMPARYLASGTYNSTSAIDYERTLAIINNMFMLLSKNLQRLIVFINRNVLTSTGNTAGYLTKLNEILLQIKTYGPVDFGKTVGEVSGLDPNNSRLNSSGYMALTGYTNAFAEVLGLAEAEQTLNIAFNTYFSNMNNIADSLGFGRHYNLALTVNKKINLAGGYYRYILEKISSMPTVDRSDTAKVITLIQKEKDGFVDLPNSLGETFASAYRAWNIVADLQTINAILIAENSQMKIAQAEKSAEIEQINVALRALNLPGNLSSANSTAAAISALTESYHGYNTLMDALRVQLRGADGNPFSNAADALAGLTARISQTAAATTSFSGTTAEISDKAAAYDELMTAIRNTLNGGRSMTPAGAIAAVGRINNQYNEMRAYQIRVDNMGNFNAQTGEYEYYDGHVPVDKTRGLLALGYDIEYNDGGATNNGGIEMGACKNQPQNCSAYTFTSGDWMRAEQYMKKPPEAAAMTAKRNAKWNLYINDPRKVSMPVPNTNNQWNSSPTYNLDVLKKNILTEAGVEAVNFIDIPADKAIYPACLDVTNNYDGALINMANNQAWCKPFMSRARNADGGWNADGRSFVVPSANTMIYLKNPSTMDYSRW